jgi:integrase
MSKQGRERALGPYQHGAGWRVIYVKADGKREAGKIQSHAEACLERDVFNEEAENRTLDMAVDRYIEAQVKAGRRGIETYRYRLVGILRFKEGGGSRQVSTVNAAYARKLYEQRCGEVANDTQQGELAYVKRFFDWCVEQGFCRLNPFTEIKPVGQKNRGKPKLRVNGTRQFLGKLLEEDTLESTAVLMALTLALRANEVVKRTVEDLDDDGRILWIRDSKTKGSDREIEIPEFLRVRLLKLAAGKQPSDPLFGDLTRHGLHYWTVKFCTKAGVNRVTPHGLRGSGATQAVRVSGGIEQVARAIGHVDGGVTLRGHYLAGGAEESARARTIASMVTDPRYPEDTSKPLADCALTPQYDVCETYEGN